MGTARRQDLAGALTLGSALLLPHTFKHGLRMWVARETATAMRTLQPMIDSTVPRVRRLTSTTSRCSGDAFVPVGLADLAMRRRL